LSLLATQYAVKLPGKFTPFTVVVVQTPAVITLGWIEVIDGGPDEMIMLPGFPLAVFPFVLVDDVVLVFELDFFI